MEWFIFALASLFLMLGLLIHVCHFDFLISGYNLLSREKKAEVDIVSLRKCIGIFGYMNAGIFYLASLLISLKMEWMIWVSFAFLLISSLYVVIKSNQLKIPTNENIKTKSNLKAVTIGSLTFGGIVILLVGILLFFSAQPTRVTYLKEGLKIHGMYGETIAWDSMMEIDQLENFPIIQARTNGSALGKHLKGYFTVAEIGRVKLFLNKDVLPVIKIKTKNLTYFLNFESSEETNDHYELIQAHLKK